MAKNRPLSRPARWAASVADAQDALDELDTAKANVEAALDDLRDVQAEYQDWRDNYPENMQGDATYEKLNTVADMDLEPDEDDLGAMRTAVEGAEAAELPRGFGRD